jgi:regulator of protease activity HflC (stomatin/prohibitin superfamily)
MSIPSLWRSRRLQFPDFIFFLFRPFPARTNASNFRPPNSPLFPAGKRYNPPQRFFFALAWFSVGEAGMELPFSFTAVLVVIIGIYLLSSIKILAEYERGVIFRLGRLLSAAKGPGLIFVFTPIDRIVRVSLRQEALEVPPQDIITRDNVTLKVNAVIFLRVIDPSKAVVEVSNYVYQTSQFAQTTLRSVLGEQELDELLSHREKINLRLQSILDQHTSPWGVKVTNVEVKQVDMPESMLRAMAKQAEAEREKRSKIIHAEGEFSAAQRLVDAAHLLATEPVSVQLRYLQTLTEIGVEKNTTVIFPVPVDFFTGLQKLLGKPGDDSTPAVKNV